MNVARRIRVPTSLGAKLVLILTGVGLIGAGALALLFASVILPGIDQLERSAVARQVALTQAAPDERGPDIALANRAQSGTGTQGRAGAQIGVATPGADRRTVSAKGIPSDLRTIGREMLLLSVAGSSLLLVMVLWVLGRMIARLVLKPLNRMERHMEALRQSGSISMLDDHDGDDEIGSLVRSFNSMLSQLDGLREQVETQSFELGRTESAVAMMHNVRNALNPISTVFSRGLSTGVDLDRGLLDKALAELSGDDIPLARRQKLSIFVSAALRAIEQEREARRQQVDIGRQALHHILEIIGQQQAAANERPPLVSCDVTDIVAQNATIARYSGQTSIAFNFPGKSHWAMASRVILSQVIGNLFSNAAEAIDATGRGYGSISVAIRPLGARVEICIRDDGEGFDPAALPTLFQRGYSTRANKSGGLGLHWCANAILAMGGSLALRSEGAGRGACAVITLGAAGMQSEHSKAA